MKTNLLISKRLMRLLSALILFFMISANSVFAASVSWDGGGADGEWGTALNWSNDLVPTAADDVTIGSSTVNITTGSFTVNSLQIYGSAANHKLSIAVSASLTVNTTTGATDAVQIGGAIIQNAGMFSITSIGDFAGVNIKNGGTPASSSVLTNLAGATLSINTTVAPTAGADKGPCIVFQQTNATAVFNTGGTINLMPAPAKKHFALYVKGGTTVQILGAGFTLASGDYSLLRSDAVSLTIGQNGGTSPAINFAASSTTIDAAIYLSAYNSASSFTNYGAITVTGTAPQGLKTYHNKGGTDPTTTLSVTNNGTLSFNGTFVGGAAVIGGATGNTISISNDGTMSFVTSAGDASQFGRATSLTNNGTLTFSGSANGINDYSNGFALTNNVAKTINITGNLNLGGSGAATVSNSGSITVTSNSGNGIGKNGATFTNYATGTLTVNSAIQATAENPVFTNNGTVVLNTGTNTGINANVAFTNNKTLKGTGAITPSATLLAPATSEIAPGNSSVSKIILSGPTNTINGKYMADINGAATAGTDYDQLDANTTTADVNVAGLTIATTFGYTPANGNTVVLINTNAGTITGTPTFVPALPTGWVASTTSGQVKLTYTAVLPVKLVSFSGVADANSNSLTWTTASETNNLGFEIQKRISENSWEKIGFVRAEGKPATYKFKDTNPTATSYYRLRQLDNDKTETFSGVVVVKQTLSANVSVSPNPTVDFVNISIPNDGVSTFESITIVFDLSGKKVLSQSNNLSNFKIDLTSLKAGTYVISLETSSANYTKKLVKN